MIIEERKVQNNLGGRRYSLQVRPPTSPSHFGLSTSIPAVSACF
ncbi:MAG: hypothetical protein ACKVOQ_18945 [Cyclobacteriaceae bacterium]